MRVNSVDENYSSYGIACVRCDDQLIAPNWSEFVSEFHVRHFWSCESCGRQFETLDDVRGSASTKARRKNPSLPLLVARKTDNGTVTRVVEFPPLDPAKETAMPPIS